MSYLDHIRECNAHDLDGFVPFVAVGRQVGWVRPGLAGRLAAFRDAFRVTGDSVALSPELRTYGERSRALDRVLRRLADEGLVEGWRGEAYSVAPIAGGEPLFEMERAACPLFGVRSFGLQVNGLVRRRGELHMWIARRSRSKPTFPGMLDVFVAGGIPAGVAPMENLLKEAEEEAGVPPEIARQAIPAGVVSYCMEVPEGLKPDVQFVFDLELPADFVPRNRDGEVESFRLEPIERVMRTVRQTREFKFNCNLVIIDFLVRHGLIGPDEPDYLEIALGLRR